MRRGEFRDPRFREIDREIESSGLKVHRVIPCGVKLWRSSRQEKRDRQITRRAVYLMESGKIIPSEIS